MMVVSKYCHENTHRLKKGRPREREETTRKSVLSPEKRNNTCGLVSQWKQPRWSAVAVTHGAHQLAHFLDRLLQRDCSHDLRQTHMTGHKTCLVTTWGAHKVWLGFFHLETETLQKLATASYHLTCCTHCVSKQTTQASFNVTLGLLFFNQDCCWVCYSCL